MSTQNANNVAITGGTIDGTTVGATTATTGRFTTVTSTIATGTAPFTVTSTTPVTNLSIGGNAATATTATTATNATNLATTNFTITESGGKLIFKYGATTIASLDSTGVFTTLVSNVSGGTP
jgi:hypothetical protein